MNFPVFNCILGSTFWVGEDKGLFEYHDTRTFVDRSFSMKPPYLRI